MRSDLAMKWLVAAAGIALYAQAQPQPAGATFEVASAKPTAGVNDRALVQAIQGRLLMQHFTPRTLIVLAFGADGYQVEGGPAWIASEQYDVQATAEGNPSVQQMEGPMLQALLANRFHLTLHREMKQMPVYEMSAIGASKLQVSRDGSGIPYDVNAPPPLATGPGQPQTWFCGFPRSGPDVVNRTMDGRGLTIANLAKALERAELHRPVIDKTGLSGKFDVLLHWTGDSATGATAPDPPDAISIFAALREQVGLKLEAARGPVEVLVIDHIEKPSAN